MSVSKGIGVDDPRLLDFWTERHLQTMTTLRRDGTPHTVPVAALFDPQRRVVRVLASWHSVKARNVARVAGAPVSVCQVDGRRWTTIEGTAQVVTDADRIADAVAAYAVRFRTPRVNPDRIVIEIAITRVMGSLPLPHPSTGPAPKE